MNKTLKLSGILFILAAGVIFALHITSKLAIKDILSVYSEKTSYGALTISYPHDGTLFPQEIPAPAFLWKDNNSKSDTWLITFGFQDNKERLNFLSRVPKWRPAEKQWKEIKARSLEKNATVTVIGINYTAPKKLLSAGSIAIKTSRDITGAPLFYREVNLPFIDAVKDPSRIRWRFGEISSKTCPPVVLTKLPVCGNCHSFSRDGSILGMDVDYANDKGSYAILPVEKEMILNRPGIITWNDYMKDDKEYTYGLLSQVSPDGNYIVSTVKDRSVFVARPDLPFSQLFFPVKGILAIYNRETKTFKELPGADDRRFVQSNPAWSPDGKYIVFTKSRTRAIKIAGTQVLLSPEECREFLSGGKTFLYDLYRIPFNNGNGGKAEPFKGASNNGMSNYFAKYSPDGKWIVFCRAKSFSLLQPDSELYIIPAEGGRARRMRCNTSRMNSWHTWSPNSRWLVFSSKASTPYTQLFITHIDEKGNDTPAVLLDRLTAPARAANIPEFINVKPGAIKKIREKFLDESSFIRAGNEYLKANDYTKAERAYRKALKFNPESAEAYHRMGLILLVQGKKKEAIAQFNEAIRLNPDDATFRYNLGNVLLSQGKVREGVNQYYEAIRLNRDYADVHYALGAILSSQGSLDEAISYYKEALRLNPKDEKVRCNLGNALFSRGKVEEAKIQYNEALKLDPKNAKVWCNMGNIYLSQGKLEEAKASYLKSIKLDPGYAQSLYNFGNVFMRQGRIKDAVEKYTGAIKLDPNYAEARCNLGMALSAQGRLDDAIVQFKEALKINPALGQAQAGLNRVIQEKMH